jgi:hypothetical protein
VAVIVPEFVIFIPLPIISRGPSQPESLFEFEIQGPANEGCIKRKLNKIKTIKMMKKLFNCFIFIVVTFLKLQ